VPPTLGNYPDTSLPLSTDTTVTPDAAPTNTTSINVSTATDFDGTLEGDPTTGVVRVTDAHPAGTYTVTVTAFGSGGATATKTFTLTVTTPVTCIPLSFAAAANFGAGTSPRSVTVGDFNGDGKQDLAVVNIGSNNVSILLGDGAGNFSAPTNFGTGASPHSVAVGDFNGDGNQDLAVANYDSNNVSILLRDCPVVVNVSVSTSTVAEGGSAIYTVHAKPAPTQNTTVNYSMSGTATQGTDYILNGTPGQVTIAAGKTAGKVKLKATIDHVTEGTETAIMTLQPGSGYTVGPKSQGTISITDSP
jgi:hypothetical protein